MVRKSRGPVIAGIGTLAAVVLMSLAERFDMRPGLAICTLVATVGGALSVFDAVSSWSGKSDEERQPTDEERKRW